MDWTRTLVELGAFPTNRTTKAPALADPNRYRTENPTQADLEAWRLAGYGFAVHVGHRGYQLIDIDEPALVGPMLDLLDDMGVDEATYLRVSTPSGGAHLWFACPCEDGNRKLAMSSDKQVRVETRGVGGYALVPPTPKYVPARPFEGILELPPISYEAWCMLCDRVKDLFDQTPIPASAPSDKAPSTGATGERPGDTWADQTDWDTLIADAGGTFVRQTGEHRHYRRPGKRDGISASTCGDGKCLKIWTSNWPPFEPQEVVTKLGFYAATQHGGDFSAAARELRRQGHGSIERAMGRKGASPGAPGASLGTAPNMGGSDALSMIETNDVGLAEMADLGLGALVAANDPPMLFVRAGRLARVMIDERGIPTIDPLNVHSVRGALARAATWIATGQKSTRTVTPPEVVAQDILHRPSYDGVPRLIGMANCPTLRTGGGLRMSRGYDDGIYTVAAEAFEVYQGSPVDAAKWLFDEVLVDFPFQASADRAHALALMLLPIVRHVVAGPTPLHLIDAPYMGTGKSLLGKVCLAPTIGAEVPAMSAPEQEDEWRKALTAALAQGIQAIFLDNVGAALKADSLAKALTATEWGDRLLGSNTMVHLPINATWVATSNNAKMSVDIARRSVWLRLNSETERPWQREGFKRDRLLSWVLANRVEVLSRLLCIVEAWDEAGRPAGKGRQGSYEAWGATMGGLLEIAEVDGFLANWEAMFVSVNDEDAPWRELFLSWWRNHKDLKVRLNEVYPIAETIEPLMELFSRASSDAARRTAFGMALKRRVDRVLEGFTLKPAGTYQGAAQYRLIPVSGNAEPTEGIEGALEELRV